MIFNFLNKLFSSSNEEFLKELNEQQKNAVISDAKQICVIAGPGCGKTRTLISKACYLVNNKKVDPKKIMTLTFTKKAIGEIKSRFKNSLGSKTSSSLKIYTIHSFCNYFLRRRISFLGLDNNFQVYEENDQKASIKRILSEELDWTKELIEKNLNRIFKIIRSAKLNSYLQEDFLPDFEAYFNNSLEIAVANSYQALLKKNNALDFADFLTKTFEILTKSEEIREESQKKFSHILVDEFQDLSYLQWKIIDKLLSEKTKIFIVGDPNQCIYSFQGANPDTIKKLQKDKDWKFFYLNVNYRSTEKIIRVSNKFILENKNGMIENILQSMKNKGDNVKLELKVINLDRIADQILFLQKERNFKFKDFLIIYRKNSLSSDIEKALIEKKIPYEVLGSFKFIERGEIKDVIAYLKSIVHKDDLSISRIVGLIDGIGKETIKSIQKVSKDENKLIADVLNEYFGDQKKRNFDKKLKERQKINLDNFTNLFNFQRDLINKEGKISEFLHQLLEKFEYRNEEIERDDNVKQFLNMILNWENKNLSNGDSIKSSVVGFLSYLSISFEDSDKDKNDDHDKDLLSLSTVHKAKGLEYKVVFFIYLDEGTVPDKRDLEDPEEKRVFYVGITRAKELLYLVNIEKSPSRFLSNLDLIVSNDLNYKISEEVKDALEVLESDKKSDLNKENKSSYEIGVISSKVSYHENKNIYFSASIFVEEEGERSIRFWKNYRPNEKFELFSQLDKGDIISFKGKWWKEENFSIDDFEIVLKKGDNDWSSVPRKINEFKFAFIDFETARYRGEIKVVEIGYVVCNEGNIIIKKNYLVKPHNFDKIKKYLEFFNNNISVEELNNAESLDVLLPIIQEDLDDCVLVSHNFKSFDYHRFKEMRFFKKELTYYFFDTYKPSKEMIKERGLESKKDLQTLIRMIRNDANFVEEHRALPDAILHMELFNYLNKSKQYINLLYRIH